MRKIVILQPSYLPWLGYFDQLEKSDVFIFLDDVHYTKNDWRNRNKIKTPSGSLWLTVPVTIKHREQNHLLINEAKISDLTIFERHKKSLELNYKKATYFSDIFSVLSEILSKEWEYLADLNIALIEKICLYLSITHTRFIRSSTIKLRETEPTARLIKLCKIFKATHYLTGPAAKSYLKENLFFENNICLEYQDYAHPTYVQLWGEFTPYLSIVDLLFNHGRESREILLS